MTLRKLFTLGIILAMFLVVPAVHAVTVMWDLYNDEDATHLKIERSINGTTWTDEKTAIDKGLTGAALTTQPDGTYIYYRMKAYNNNTTSESIPSNVVDFTWDSTTTGGGSSIQSPGGFGFVDCDNVTSGSPEEQACTDSGELPE